jgi:tetratricopeptide (TPR) repeat protein
MMGTRALAMTALMGGDFAEALRRHDEAFALHDPDPDRAFTRVVGQEQSVSSRSYHAINLWVVGREDEAWQRAEESVRLAKEIDHANSLGYGFMHATLVALCARRPEFPSLTAELIAISTEHRLQMWREFGLQFDAIRRLGDGDLAALADLKTARAALASRHAHLFSSLLALEAAHRLIAHGHANEALPLIDEAEAIIEASGERYAEAEYHRVRALHLSATGANAEPAFAEALRIARGQGAKAWEQRVLETARK